MDKTKKRRKGKILKQDQEDARKETEVLRKRVKSLMKKRRANEVRKIVRNEDFKSWGRDTQAKVCAIWHMFLKA